MRNDYAFVVNLIGYPDDAGRTAADIDMMGDVCEIAEDLYAKKDGANKGNVVKVHAPINGSLIRMPSPSIRCSGP
jgi:hypothetical protein